MRGMQALVSMRLRGDLPRSVALEMDWEPHPDLAKWVYDGSRLSVSSTEKLHSLDLRALQGLMVWVTGGEKAKALATACMDAGAKRVIATIRDGGEQVEIVDTEGVLSWTK